MGRPKKPDAVRRVSANGGEKRKPKTQAVAPLANSKIGFVPPTGLLPETINILSTVMSSDIASGFLPSDIAILNRYAAILDQRNRLSASVEEMVTVGASGQFVVHPALRHISTLDSELRQIEDRLGLNPLARNRLGLVAANKELTLEQLRDVFKTSAIEIPVEDDPRMLEWDAETSVDDL